MKLLEENTGEMLEDIGMGKEFLDMTQNHTKQNKNRKIGLHQTKRLLNSKGNNQHTKKRQPIE